MAFDTYLDRLTINAALARTILVDFIRSEVTRVGFSRAVIGLSGGIDSALVAYLTVEALGPENVLGVRMPYETSSQESLDHAQLVIDALGIEAETVDITPMVTPLFERFSNEDATRRGNIMARQRMIVLYDQSAATDALVMGTGNKTEMLLGYSTLHGDSAAAIHPVGDFYKHQIRQLAREVGVPDVIVDKPPSADLFPGQTDEGDLGYTYDEADQALYFLLDRRYTVDETVEAGFERSFVEAIWEQVRRTQYKRKMPLILKISQRTVGYDFLYMRDWGT